MTYTFKCPNCGQNRFINIKMECYEAEKGNQRCTNCNSKMERVIEWTGLASDIGGYSDVGGNAKWQSS